MPEYLRIDDIEKQNKGVVTQVDKDLKPIILKNGFVYSHARTEGVRGQYLSTHSTMQSWRGEHDSEESHVRYFLQNLAIHSFQNCLHAAQCSQKYSQQLYETLGKHCLKFVSLEHAETAFMMCKNVGMVYSI